MKRVLLTTLWLLSPLAVSADTEMSSALAQRIDGDASGACIAASRIQPNAQGELQVERSFRCANGSHRSITADTRFEIGSISKAMLGGIVARLHQDEVLSVDDPVDRWLPDGVQLPTHNGEVIRIRHLLTHSSGLPRLPANLSPANVQDPYADYTEAQLLEALSQFTPEFALNERFGYSNFAVMTLSYVVSRAAGRPLSELYQDYLYTPIGMTHTSFTGDTMQGMSGEGRPMPNWNFPTNMEGVGGVRSTLRDMERWVRAQLGQGSPAVIEALKLSQQALETADSTEMAWGWILAPVGERVYVSHGGGTGGFTAAVFIDPSNQSASIVSTNGALHQTGDIQLLGLHLLDQAIPPGQAYVVAEVPEDISLADYTGEYPLFPGFSVRVFEQAGALMIQGTGQGAAEVRFVEPDVFENVAHGARFVFERNANGEIIAVTLHQAGQQLRGERILQPTTDESPATEPQVELQRPKAKN
ncbi:MAG: serine hydrolase [Idiomarina sp.]|nr:serine hydrolase [Idiomarina sp.]